MSRTVVFDLETDGFLEELTLMSVAWTYHIEGDEWKEWKEEDTSELFTYLQDSSLLVAHNGIAFDKPAMAKLESMKLTTPIYDTMVASRLRNPDLYGGHSLRAWGIRLGILKGTIKEDEDDEATAYGVYSEELSIYCKQDVTVTIALFEKLTTEMSQEAIDLDPINWEEFVCNT